MDFVQTSAPPHLERMDSILDFLERPPFSDVVKTIYLSIYVLPNSHTLPDSVPLGSLPLTERKPPVPRQH